MNKSLQPTILVTWLALFLGGVCQSGWSQGKQYTVTNLQFVNGSALNDKGQVVGTGDLGTGRQPFVWDAVNGFQDLGVPPGFDFAIGLGINNQGQVSGNAFSISNPSGTRLFYWDKNIGFQDSGLPSLEIDAPVAGGNTISDSGEIAASLSFSRAVLWSPTSGLQNLGTPCQDPNNPGQFLGITRGNSISRNGTFVTGIVSQGSGECNNTNIPIVYSAVWSAGAWTALNPAQLTGDVIPVNNLGQIVGTLCFDVGCHATLWTNNVPQDLGTLPGDVDSSPLNLNDSGQVVGNSFSAQGVIHPFIWDSTNGMRDLNSLIPADSGVTLRQALAINNVGQILADSTGPVGHTFLLSLQDSQQCTNGTTIANVGLPLVVDPNVLGNKPYFIVYEGLDLNFTEIAPPNATSGILCSAQSNTGSLNVDLRFGNGESETFAHSTTSATVTMFNSAALEQNLDVCDFKFFFGVNNNCILNGSFDPTATFINWFSPGFATEIKGWEPRLLQTGPLSFWVNINALGLSQDTSFETILRVVEPFIHRTLISNLPMISLYTLTVDPGVVSLAFTNNQGLTTGVLADGTISTQIPLSHYFSSPANPAVLIVGDLTGTNLIRVTGVRDGSYDISAVSKTVVFPTGIATQASGFLLQGQSLAYAFTLPGDSTKTPTLTIDDIPPATTASLTPSPNNGGWNRTNVTISLNSSDGLDGSGVKQITYSASGAQTAGPFTVSGGYATILVDSEGLTTVTYFAIDNAGNVESTHTLQVRIDKTPPVVACNAFPNVLWPPNHKLVTVNASVNVTDSLSGANGFQLLSVTNSELDSGQGDTVGWTVGLPSTVGQLRATRLGNGLGRTYTLTYRGFDTADNSVACSVIVSVPRDQGQ